ncbi:hypothetical protein BH18ACT5_BH18ACT5_05520 [soil metagenome]
MLCRGRSDDTEETIRSRFRIYEQQTAPLLDIYNERGLVFTVDGLGEIDEVTDRLLAVIES